METGYIYEGKYEGWYCIADEMFLAEDQTKIIKLPNGQDQRVSIESNRPVEWFSEENYMFKLSKCRNDLNKWLESGNCEYHTNTSFNTNFFMYFYISEHRTSC